jgi:hypothetical protein
MRTRTYLPRPEYPRPDLQRAFIHEIDWLNLNGAWEFRFDGHDEGIGNQWYLPGGPRWEDQIMVPFCWESLAAWGEADSAGNDNYFSSRVFRNPLEVTRFNYRYAARYEIGWYRRRVVVPQNEHWDGKRVILTVGAADFFTDCWCNGEHMGRHEGGYTPFQFDVTDVLERTAKGQLVANLVIRVHDPQDNHEQPVGKQWGWYSTASGIWQTVYLEPRAMAHIVRFETRSDIATEEVQLKVFTEGGSHLIAEVVTPSGLISSYALEVVDGVAAAVLPTKPAMLWEPSNPQLYRLTLTLHDSGRKDVVHSYFGIRSLSAFPAQEGGAPATLALNGQAIYIRGALYQSYFPEGIYTAGDVQTIRDDIEYAKRVGFDLLRVHIKIDDPLLLYFADTMGMLLMADFPNFGEGGDTPLGRERYETTMRRAIERDFNHPSIVAWCLFNETWGFGGLEGFVDLINPKPVDEGVKPFPLLPGEKLATSQSAYTWIEAMWNLAKSLDETRLIEDMSVVAWEHLQQYGHGSTDINSWHFYTSDYAWARRHIQEVVEETYEGSSFNYIPGFEQGAQPLINSEYGGVGALDGDCDISWSFKFLTNELRRHGELSAYVFTELHDVEWERNGFLNYDRTPKDFGYDPKMINQADVLPIDAPPIQRCKARQKMKIDVFSSHYSPTMHEKVTLTWRLSGIDTYGWLNDDLASGSKAIPFTHLRVELAERIEFRLPKETMLCTLWVRAIAADGTQVARNYVQFFVDAGFKAREELSDRVVLRVQPADWLSSEWRDPIGREAAVDAGMCWGEGYGFFEWSLPLQPDELEHAQRIRLLCEASAHTAGNPQTDPFMHPTQFVMLLNGVRVYSATLPNHPHDTRGALSYMGLGKGSYGYLAHATVEGDLLREVMSHGQAGALVLRCMVPAEAANRGGLTIYGGDTGRYPVPPTLIIERKPEVGSEPREEEE